MCRVWPWYSVSPGRLPPTITSTPWLPRMRCSRLTSARRGTLSRMSVWSVSRLAIISGSVAFFAPEIGIAPLSGRPPTMRMRSILVCPRLVARPPIQVRAGPIQSGPNTAKVRFVAGILALPVALAARRGIGRRGRRPVVGRFLAGRGPAARLRLAALEIGLERRRQPLGAAAGGAFALLARGHGVLI